MTENETENGKAEMTLDKNQTKSKLLKQLVKIACLEVRTNAAYFVSMMVIAVTKVSGAI